MIGSWDNTHRTSPPAVSRRPREYTRSRDAFGEPHVAVSRRARRARSTQILRGARALAR